MKMARNRRLRPLPLRSLAPNILTVLALCAGLTAIRFSLLERWELAVLAIVVAGILDGLDGRLARLLKGTTKFGAELDSLSDFVSFGVAPGILIYNWTLHHNSRVGWIVVLAFAVGCALRLARFNTALEDPDRPAYMSNFFTGVPAPGGAALAILPMMLSFQGFEEIFRQPLVMGPHLLFVAFLMVSRIPTYAFKRLRVSREHVLPMLMMVGLAAAIVVSFPWLTMSVLGAAYLGSIPFSARSYRRLKRESAEAAQHETPAEKAPAEE
jgi:CDP-diacylglycerol--serine O-phosphatidyltransferase